MQALSIAKDAKTLEPLFAMRLKKDGAKAINASGLRSQYLPWVEHILGLRELLSVSSHLAEHLTIEEIQNLAMLESAISKYSSTSKRCPACKQITTALFSCEYCGKKLT